jgi:hypothetical protein
MRDPADTRSWEVARAAGGLTWQEMGFRRYDLAVRERETLTHWLDEHSDLWLPKGILLFRPWLGRPDALVRRDVMQLEG